MYLLSTYFDFEAVFLQLNRLPKDSIPLLCERLSSTSSKAVKEIMAADHCPPASDFETVDLSEIYQESLALAAELNATDDLQLKQLELRKFITNLCASANVKMAQSVISKAVLEADQIEDFQFLDFLLTKQKDLPQLSDEQRSDIYKRRLKVKDQQINFLYYQSILNEVISSTTKHPLHPSADELQYYRVLLNKAFLKDENHANSFRSKVLFHLAHALIHSRRNENELSVDHYEKVIELYEQNTILLQLNESTYIAAVNNLINVLLKVQSFENALSLIEKFKNLPANISLSDQAKQSIKLHSSIKEMRVYLKQALFNKASLMIPDITRLLKSQDHSAITVADFRLLVVNTQLHLGKHDEATFWINKILNDADSNSLNDHLANANMAQLLIYQVNENHKALKLRLESFKKLISDLKLRSGFEVLFAEMMRQLLQAGSDNQQRLKVYMDYLEIFENFLNKPQYNGLYNDFNIMTWLKQQINVDSETPIAWRGLGEILTKNLRKRRFGILF